jgi:TonB family protein
MDAVSQVLVDRDRAFSAMERMIGKSVAASLIAHVVFVAALVLAPAWLLGGGANAEPENLMTISLGGPSGPDVGGMTTIGGRPIQSVSEARKTIEPVRPPAAKTPEMIEPKKSAPKRAEAKVENTAKDPKSRTPTKGAEVREGSSVSETNARGQGFGLQTGGGFGSGSYLDVANFCCPEYLSTMLELIRRNWDERQQAAGTTVVKYTIQRNGTITDVVVEKPSGYPALDFMAQRALLITRQLQPLPAAFTEPSLTVHLVFSYRR